MTIWPKCFVTSLRVPKSLAGSPRCHRVQVDVVPGVLIALPAVPLSPDDLGDAAVEVGKIVD